VGEFYISVYGVLHLITRIAGTLPADISCIEAPANLAGTEPVNVSHSHV
jgi:hypothetical protein